MAILWGSSCCGRSVCVYAITTHKKGWEALSSILREAEAGLGRKLNEKPLHDFEVVSKLQLKIYKKKCHPAQQKITSMNTQIKNEHQQYHLQIHFGEQKNTSKESVHQSTHLSTDV